MTAFPGIFAVTIKKIPMGFAKTVGWEMVGKGHLCSYEGKVNKANMGWGREKGSRVRRPRPLMTSFGCLDSAMPESSITSFQFHKTILSIKPSRVHLL